MDTMTCPNCKSQVVKKEHKDAFECKCGWRMQAMSYEALKNYRRKK